MKFACRMVVFLSIALAFTLPATSAAAARRPNILLLVADEYRHDCLGVAGHPIVKTPNFDRLASEGTRFTQAYAASPVCSPSRASFFTGRYPQVHGVQQNRMSFNAGEVVLPQILRANGYTTAMVGKLHLQGYDDWFDYSQIDNEGSSDEYKAFLAAKGHQMEREPNVAAIPGTLVKPDQTQLKIGTSVLPEELFPEAWEADRAIDFLRQQKGKEKPWFLYLSMFKPHSEFVIPAPFDKMYAANEMPLPSTFKPGLPRPENFSTNRDPDKPKDPDVEGAGKAARLFINDQEILKEVIAHYYGSITMVDKHMGRVIAALDELGCREDTIVIFTSDHGNMLGERNRLFKGVMYEASARVPMIVRGPGVAAGKVSDDIFDNTTVTPTLLELVGLPIPSGMQGKSLMPLLRGGGSGSNVAFSWLSDKMVRQGDWKLIVPLNPKRGAPELYNVVKDPNEQENLYDKPDAVQVQKRLSAMLDEWDAQRPVKVPLPQTK